MKIIKDLRILKAISTRMNLEIDNEFYYVIKNNLPYPFSKFLYKKKYYKLKYFSGCFYPFIISLDDN